MVTLLLLVSSPPVAAFLGIHKTCPRCDGTGRDPGTLLITSCPKCGGDGEVGLLMDDEGLEDMISFGLIAIIIVAVVGAILASAFKKPKTPPSQPTVIKPQPPQRAIAKGEYCKSCGRSIPPDSVFCPYCKKRQ